MKDITVSPDITIRKALKVLNKTANGILLVVDNDHCLLGCLSDGDIRRQVLINNDLNMIIDGVYNNNPITLNTDYNLDDAKKLLLENRIDLIPVIDNKNRLIECLDWKGIIEEPEHDNFHREKLDLPVVIMAGGIGTRLRPITNVLPKLLIPLGNETIMELILGNFNKYSINNYYLILHHKANLIKSFTDELDHEANFTYIIENKPLGTAGGLNLLKDHFIKETSFFLTNCDILINCNLANVYHDHIQNNDDITIVAAMKNYQIPYGVCELGENGKLNGLKEKPEFDFIVNTGLYIINTRILKYIEKDEVLGMNELIEKLIVKKLKISVFPIKESNWLDIGEISEYKKVLNKFY